MKRLGLLSFFALGLLSCSFAPKYQRPSMPIPEHYKESKQWQKAKGLSALQEKEAWWTMYQDPVLNELEHKVSLANQNIKLALAHYQRARALSQVVRAAYYPSLFSIANANKQETSENVANPNNNTAFSDFLLGANLNYEVDLWGRVRNAVAASQARTQAGAADLAAVSLSMHAELALNYFNLRGIEAAQIILDKTVNAYQKALSLVQKRYRGGIAPIADVDEARTQLENAKTRATELRLTHAKLEHAIAILVGEVPASFTLPKASVPIKTVKVAPYLPSTLLERRPDIIAAEQRVQAANLAIGVACAAFYPQINLMSIIGFESESLGRLLTKPSLFWSLGAPTALAVLKPLVNQMIFDGGRLRGLLNKAKANYWATVANYRQTVLTAFQEVEDSLITLRRLDEEQITQTAATTAALHALQQANDRYFGGIVNYLNVIVNENRALATQLALVNITTRRQLASVNLIRALGGGWTCCGKCV